MTGRAAAVALVAALGASGCGAPLVQLPSGNGVPAQDAAEIVAQATGRCSGVRTLAADIAFSGSVGGRRVSGRLSAGVSAPASVRLEAMAPFGPPLFIFVATGDEATLLLPHEDRVLEHGRPDLVLKAIAGIPLAARDMLPLLTGCPFGPAESRRGRQIGDAWRVVPAGNEIELYFHREPALASWRLVSSVQGPGGEERSWRADFTSFQESLPRLVRVASLEGAGADAGFDLRLVLSQVDVNVSLDADAFRVRIPPTAVPMRLEELRQTGLLSVPGKRAGADEPSRETGHGR
jgi:hypothetical protein